MPDHGKKNMKLLMKQRVFSWTDTYDVYDEAGNKKYFVRIRSYVVQNKKTTYSSWTKSKNAKTK